MIHYSHGVKVGPTEIQGSFPIVFSATKISPTDFEQRIVLNTNLYFNKNNMDGLFNVVIFFQSDNKECYLFSYFS